MNRGGRGWRVRSAPIAIMNFFMYLSCILRDTCQNVVGPACNWRDAGSARSQPFRSPPFSQREAILT